MSGPPSASVVVPALNAAASIGACVDSLLALEYPSERLELIVVDNGSEDETPVLARQRGERVKVLTEQARGAGPARNAGMRAAEGELVAFTDSDCLADPAWLRIMVATLRDDRVGIACGEVRAIARDTAAERYDEFVHDTRRAVEVWRPPYAVGSNWASPRSLLLDLGGFDPEFIHGQDVDLSYRVLKAGYEIRHAPRAIISHRNERTPRGLAREGFRHGRHGRRVQRKHRAFLESYGVRDVRPPAWGRIASRALEAFRGPDRRVAACEVAFLSGKRAGMAYGKLAELRRSGAVEGRAEARA